MTRYMTRTDRNRIVGARLCDACGAPVHRHRTSGDDRIKLWAPDPEGRFWLHPVTGVMHVYDETLIGDFWRFRLHSCIMDGGRA